MRSKEEAADYRYFPEPDLVPFVIDRELIARVGRSLPELPAQRRTRFQEAFQLSAYDAQVLTQDRALAQLFEGALQAGASPKLVANWLMGDLLAYLNAKGIELEALNPAPASGRGGVKLRPEWLAHLLELIADGTISGKMAKGVFLQMLEGRKDPAAIVQERGLKQIVDAGALEQIADAVLQTNAKSVADYLRGKTGAFTHLMGEAMKRSQGKANPRQMTAILTRKLGDSKINTGEGGDGS